MFLSPCSPLQIYVVILNLYQTYDHNLSAASSTVYLHMVSAIIDCKFEFANTNLHQKVTILNQQQRYLVYFFATRLAV